MNNYDKAIRLLVEFNLTFNGGGVGSVKTIEGFLLDKVESIKSVVYQKAELIGVSKEDAKSVLKLRPTDYAKVLFYGETLYLDTILPKKTVDFLYSIPLVIPTWGKYVSSIGGYETDTLGEIPPAVQLQRVLQDDREKWSEIDYYKIQKGFPLVTRQHLKTAYHKAKNVLLVRRLRNEKRNREMATEPLI